MRRYIPNLFIVGGDGRNSGKTSLVCRIIGQLKEQVVTGVKISSHFHEPSPGLINLDSGEGYKIFEESNMWSTKDTSRMLQGGAGRVFYSQVTDTGIEIAFSKIIDLIPVGTPIVVESPSLIKYFEPGVFVIMRGSGKPDKNLDEIENFTHMNFSIDELDRTDHLSFSFTDCEWRTV